MILVDSVKSVLREVYKKRGYIVIGTPGVFNLGQVTTKLFQYEMGSNFVVEKDTDVSDWKKQSDLIAEIKPEWIRYSDPKDGKFYRVVPEKSPKVSQ